ncbi:MAG: asparagine synthase (glutamine-hydrolyzing) [Candidatus Sumerlaeaceae bacterium]|nr:asparagine synthase (glutamine-hydrolyzing) [Candidatus Sumerlaeaceae bacterium]
MCGIVGKVYLDPNRPVEPEILERMKQCIIHRGPDDHGTHIHKNMGFGFQRLSIIDLATGHQPMLNEDGTVAIVFNGEIYNFLELRKQLLAFGHRFQTRSDTEVILHGYEEWGSDVTLRLRGMFAFAIFDTKTQTLFLARDRAGKKPLYYAIVEPGTPREALIFASELKCLLAEPTFSREVDLVALGHYLTYQYVPHPWSIFQQAKKVEPGNWITWRNGRLRQERYWNLHYEPKTPVRLEEAVEQGAALLDEAVKIRLMSEVPLGCFLSGGVDSSTVVAFMRRHITGPLRTFSIGFEEEKFNELPYARQVARQFETEHHEMIVRPDALECVARLAWHFDEPFADSSAIPTYYLAKMTRRHVVVALNGDGGDESFAGYVRYLGFPALRAYEQIPRVLRRLWAYPLAVAFRTFSSSAKLELWNYVNRVSLMPFESRYVQMMVIFRDYQKRELFLNLHRDSLHGPIADSEYLTEATMLNGTAIEPIDRMMFADVMLYLPGALLPKVDRTTMAVSLEGRSPLLDHVLMEWAARLPVEVKFPNGQLKFLLKQIAGRFFTNEFLNRPKQGFGVPIGLWFRTTLRGLLEDFLLSERSRNRGFFEPSYVKRIVDQHMSGAQNHAHRLWALLMFEAWARTFLDRSDPLAGPLW